jgi:hypothetical protein
MRACHAVAAIPVVLFPLLTLVLLPLRIISAYYVR